MSRYVNVLKLSITPEDAQNAINEYLVSEGFRYISERGEMVWRKGMGALANPQFIKAEPAADGTVRLEAWTAGASLLPGVYGGELNPMEGVMGFGPKLSLKPRVRELERRLGGVSIGGGGAASVGSSAADPAAGPAAGWYPDPSSRHEQRYWNGSAWTADVADAGATSSDPL